MTERTRPDRPGRRGGPDRRPGRLRPRRTAIDSRTRPCARRRGPPATPTPRSRPRGPRAADPSKSIPTERRTNVGAVIAIAVGFAIAVYGAAALLGSLRGGRHRRDRRDRARCWRGWSAGSCCATRGRRWRPGSVGASSSPSACRSSSSLASSGSASSGPASRSHPSDGGRHARSAPVHAAADGPDRLRPLLQRGPRPRHRLRDRHPAGQPRRHGRRGLPAPDLPARPRRGHEPVRGGPRASGSTSSSGAPRPARSSPTRPATRRRSRWATPTGWATSRPSTRACSCSTSPRTATSSARRASPPPLPASAGSRGCRTSSARSMPRSRARAAGSTS